MNTWFYTDKRHSNELPLGTRVHVVPMIDNSQIHHIWEGRSGIVVGYRSVLAIVPTGWHYIRFDDDAAQYDDPGSMPYVHRDYLTIEV